MQEQRVRPDKRYIQCVQKRIADLLRYINELNEQDGPVSTRPETSACRDMGDVCMISTPHVLCGSHASWSQRGAHSVEIPGFAQMP
jgi:hypothetical protein